MKLMTYTMQYLTSILSIKNSNKSRNGVETKVDQLQQDIIDLKKENELLRKDVEEVVLCINQLASSMATVIGHMTPSPANKKDPIDEMLDSFWKKDDTGGGYLN